MRGRPLPNENKDRQEKARILIVDDHPIVRQGLAQVLNLQADLQLCCEASNAEEAMDSMSHCNHDFSTRRFRTKPHHYPHSALSTASNPGHEHARRIVIC